MKTPINKIIDFSTVDGPGCRTAIFVQGCNIHCLYCHNPETQNICINCGKCVDECPSKALSFNEYNKVVWDNNKCINCDNCIKTCKHNSSPKILYLDSIEVFNKVKNNLPFIRGITVSGGECSLYPDFLEELFKLAKANNLSTLLDSNGMVLFENLPSLMDVTDGVMLDIKSWAENTYKNLTGFSNKNVKQNLMYLTKNNKLEEIRIVYVPELVDAKKCLEGIKEIIGEKIKTTLIKLICFRNNGVRSSLSNRLNVTKEEIEEIYQYALSLGYKNLTIL